MRYTVISYSKNEMASEPSSLPAAVRPPPPRRTSFPSRPCAPSARRRATSTCASCPRPARKKAWPAMRWCRGGAATATKAKWRSTPPAARCGCAAGPTATSCAAARASGPGPRRRNQDLPRRLRRHPRQPPRAALGPGPQLRLDAVRARRPRRHDRGAGLPRPGHRRRDRARRAPHPRPACASTSRRCARATAPGRTARPATAPRSATPWRSSQFPYRAFRTGQRELAEAVYRAGVGGRCLMAQAPTGIGKTLATIFPLLKARAAQDRQALLPHRQDLGPPGGARCLARARQGPGRRAGCACSNSRRAKRCASTPTAPATATPARWPAASTTGCPPRASRPRRSPGSTGRRCATSPSRTRCAPISSRRK
jgi:hypothetical protein